MFEDHIDEAEVYTQLQGKVPWMTHNEGRAQKWAALTGYESEKKPGALSEEHGEFCRMGMEIMFENTVEWLAQEDRLAHIGVQRMARMMPDELQEAIDSTAISPFAKYALPLVRRLYPVLWAQSLVTVWPTPLPDPKVFFLDFQYGTAKTPTTAGLRNDLLSNIDRTYGGFGNVYENHAGTGAATTFDLETAEVVSASVAVWFDGVEQTSGFSISAGSGAGGVDQLSFTAAPGSGVQILVRYGTYAEGDTPRDIDMAMSNRNLAAKDIALRVGWNVQSAQDALAYHGLSVEKELTGAMSSEMAGEIDLNILMLLFKRADHDGAGTVSWSMTGYLAGDTTTEARRAYFESLGDAVREADDLIYSSSKGRANSTYLVCGTTAAQWLMKINSFSAVTGQVAPGVGGATPAGGEFQRRVKLGSIDTTRTVYKDPRVPASEILLGFKHPNPIFMGAVYSPYRMFYTTPALHDPTANFRMKKGVLSRAALDVIKSNFFAKVKLTA